MDQVQTESRDLCHTEGLDRDGLTYEECCCAVSTHPIWWGSTNTPCVREHEDGFYEQCPSGKGTCLLELSEEVKFLCLQFKTTKT